MRRNTNKMRKKGFVLSLDALIALSIILIFFTLILTLKFFSPLQTSVTKFKHMHYISEDALELSSKQGILDQIGEKWATNHTENVSNLVKPYFDPLIPPHMGYKLEMDGEVLYSSDNDSSRPKESDSEVELCSKRLISGYMSGAPVQGDVARTYLVKIKGKAPSTYAFFGGFVGQGDLTRFIFLPEDAEISDVYLEVSTGDNFNLYINDNQCGGVYTKSAGHMMADKWTINSSCYPFFTIGGESKIDIIFTGTNMSNKYIGGGFFRATYETYQMDTRAETNKDWFPFTWNNT